MLLPLSITPQETDDSCGISCLASIYQYWNHQVSIESLEASVEKLNLGGTLSVNLGRHALAEGFSVDLFSYNLQVFDPTWASLTPGQLIDKLRLQMSRKKRLSKLQVASAAYINFIEMGGRLRFSELSQDLITRKLEAGLPIIAGLCSTYLYQSAREHPRTTKDDDVGGYPAGHFVVVHGYHASIAEVEISDPFRGNPIGLGEHSYRVQFPHFLAAVFLGVVTYDANLLIISKKGVA